jgi:DNA repair photolyase
MEVFIMKKTKGTKEWAIKNINIQVGCENGCKYCYAEGIANRFKRLENREWNKPIKNKKAISKGYRKILGRIMFPSSHDITPNNVKDCLIVLKKMLKSKNEVLIVTKPNFDCIKELCYELRDFKDQILFRFTINTFNEYLSVKYEPNAPSPKERFLSLQYAYNKGFNTSISAEPYLFGFNSYTNHPIPFLKEIYPFITHTIWVGPMNKRYCPAEFWNKEIWSKKNQIKLYNHLRNYLNPLIWDRLRFKDSFNKI